MARRPDAYSCNRTVLSELERRLCGRAGPGAVACGGSPQMPGAGRGRGTGEIGCRMSPSDVTRVPNFAIACALNKRAPPPAARPPSPPRVRTGWVWCAVRGVGWGLGSGGTTTTRPQRRSAGGGSALRTARLRPGPAPGLARRPAARRGVLRDSADTRANAQWGAGCR